MHEFQRRAGMAIEKTTKISISCLHTERKFCSKFKRCDDMAKICMGPVTAVSRYHQERRVFMNDDAPNLADHDTPNPGYLLNCSGYQKLVENANKKEVIDQAYTTDTGNDFS